MSGITLLAAARKRAFQGLGRLAGWVIAEAGRRSGGPGRGGSGEALVFGAAGSTGGSWQRGGQRLGGRPGIHLGILGGDYLRGGAVSFPGVRLADCRGWVRSW